MPPLVSQNRSFGSAIFSRLIVIGILPVMILSVFYFQIIDSSSRAKVDAQVALSFKLSDHIVEERIRWIELYLKHLGHMIQGQPSLESINSHLVEFGSEAVSPWETFTYLDEQGTVLDIIFQNDAAYSSQDIVGSDFSALPYVQARFQEPDKAFLWSSVYLSPLSQQYAVALTHRLPNQKLLAVTFTLEAFYSLLYFDIEEEPYSVMLLDEDNQVIFHPEYSVHQFRETLGQSISSKQLEARDAFEFDFRGRRYQGISRELESLSWRLLVYYDMDYIKAQRQRFGFLFGISVFLCLLTALAVAYWFRKTIQRQLDRLSRSTQLIANLQFDEQAGVNFSTFSEFRSVETSFQDMAKALKKRDHDLAQQQKHYETLFNAGADIIILTDPKFEYIIDINEKGIISLGLASDEIQEISLESIIPNDYAAMLDAHRRAIIEQRSAMDEIPLILADDEKEFFELNSKLYETEQGEFIISIARNIESHRNTEQLLLEAKNKAEASNKAKDTFLAVMSHELRTPLNSIIGFGSLLKDDLRSQEHKEYLQYILNSGTHLMRLFNDILDYSKLVSGKLSILPINYSPKDLAETIESFANERILTTNKDINFSVNCAPSCPDIFSLDPDRVRQILINLVNNAIKFTDRGSITLYVSYLPAEQNSSKMELVFEITDTGIGMTESAMKRIWKPFIQNDSSYKRKYDGAGLGLSICKKLVDSMGGSIGCTSELSVGSTFTFRLPEKTTANKKLQSVSSH